VILDIKKETALLVEVKDISDELDISKTVLDNQKKTMKDMDRVTQELTKGSTTTATSKDENFSLESNRVLESHLYRIQKMKTMTENSYKGVSSPLYPFPSININCHLTIPSLSSSIFST